MTEESPSFDAQELESKDENSALITDQQPAETDDSTDSDSDGKAVEAIGRGIGNDVPVLQGACLG
jgi:hypothetical protein